MTAKIAQVYKACAVFLSAQANRKELWFNIPSRRGFVNITPQVEACLAESGIQGKISLKVPCQNA